LISWRSPFFDEPNSELLHELEVILPFFSGWGYVEKSHKKDTPSFDSVKLFLGTGETGWDDLWHDYKPLSLRCPPSLPCGVGSRDYEPRITNFEPPQKRGFDGSLLSIAVLQTLLAPFCEIKV
jgi:hypothetical protein